MLLLGTTQMEFEKDFHKLDMLMLLDEVNCTIRTKTEKALGILQQEKFSKFAKETLGRPVEL
jgi:hypothetical protein